MTEKLTEFLNLFTFSEHAYHFISHYKIKNKHLKLTNPDKQYALSKSIQTQFQETMLDIAALHETPYRDVMIELQKQKLMENLQNRISAQLTNEILASEKEPFLHKEVAKAFIKEVFLPMSEIGEKICIKIKGPEV